MNSSKDKKEVKRISHVAIWGRRFPRNKNSQCKGPEVGVCPVCPWNSKEQREQGESGGDEAERKGPGDIGP